MERENPDLDLSKLNLPSQAGSRNINAGMVVKIGAMILVLGLSYYFATVMVSPQQSDPLNFLRPDQGAVIVSEDSNTMDSKQNDRNRTQGMDSNGDTFTSEDRFDMGDGQADLDSAGSASGQSVSGNDTVIDESALDGRVEIFTKDRKQEISMSGWDIMGSSDTLQNSPDPAQIISWMVQDIELNLCRVYIDKKQETIKGTKDFSVYDQQVKIMKMIKTLRPDIKFVAAMNEAYEREGDNLKPISFLPEHIQYRGNQEDSKASSWAINDSKYAQFWSDYLSAMDNQGVGIDYIHLWFKGRRIVSDGMAQATYNQIKKLLGAEVKLPGLVGGGGDDVVSSTGILQNSINRNILPPFGVLVTEDKNHIDGSIWNALIQLSNSAGSPILLADANNLSHGWGNETAGSIYPILDMLKRKIELYRLGLQGELISKPWTNDEKNQPAPVSFEGDGSARRLMSYYVLKHWMNSVARSVRVESEVQWLGSVENIVFKKDNDLNIWLVNYGMQAYDAVGIEVSGADIESSILCTVWDQQSTEEGNQSKKQISNNQLIVASLPSKSVMHVQITLKE